MYDVSLVLGFGVGSGRCFLFRLFLVGEVGYV